jgi:hypothetical protein
MVLIDRRKGGDRRRDGRYRVSLDVAWEGPSGRWEGTMNDVSRSGCYILTEGEVDDGDQINIEFPLNDLGSSPVCAEVANHAFEIGFGVKFCDLSIIQQQNLDKYIRMIEQR